MKRTLRLLTAVCLTALTTFSASAQNAEKDYEPYPYTFIGVQGGGQVTFTNCAIDKLVTPIGAVSIGRFFTPEVGARLNVQGWNNKGGYKINGNDETYKLKYATTDLDLMLNLSNIFSKNKDHAFNVILIGGVGLSYAWDNDEQDELAAKYNMVGERNAWLDDRIVHNLRVGLQFELNVAKHWGINLELQANNLDDRFNAKFNNSDDWQTSALLGVTYKFGFKKKQHTTVAPVQTVQNYDNNRSNEQAVAVPPVPKEKKAEPVKEKAKTRQEVFFNINSSTPTATENAKVTELAQWLKDHPDANVTLTGYADKGTGTSEVNRKISMKRVNAVAKTLTDKYGISSSRIKTEYKGDTVQPFAENDKNRAVIGEAAE